MTRETRYKVNMVLRYVILLAVGVVMVYPLIWMIGASFMTNGTYFQWISKRLCRIPGNDASSFHGKYI